MVTGGCIPFAFASYASVVVGLPLAVHVPLCFACVRRVFAVFASYFCMGVAVAVDCSYVSALSTIALLQGIEAASQLFHWLHSRSTRLVAQLAVRCSRAAAAIASAAVDITFVDVVVIAGTVVEVGVVVVVSVAVVVIASVVPLPVLSSTSLRVVFPHASCCCPPGALNCRLCT